MRPDDSAGCIIGWAHYTTCKMSVTLARLWQEISGRRILRDVATLPRMDADYTPQEVADLLAEGEIQLIDVREPSRARGGPDRRRPADRSSAAQCPRPHTIDRERPVVFYCRSGAARRWRPRRSRGAGFDAHNMTGGLLDWDAAGLPLEPDGGYVATLARAGAQGYRLLRAST